MDKSVTAVVIKVGAQIILAAAFHCAATAGRRHCRGDDAALATHPQGLAEHKDELGAPLCPCRHYDDKAAEAAQGFWNCPCVPMRERKVSPAPGRAIAPPKVACDLRLATSLSSFCRPSPQECHCMLFLTEDNDFRGEEQDITLDEVVELTEGM